MKRCLRCHHEKPLSAFFKNAALEDGLTIYCKECVRLMCRDWERRNPAKHRGYRLKSKYGLSHERFALILSDQQGRCDICRRDITARGAAHVDHDHGTNKVRGLLCGSCNRAIGLLQHDPFIVHEAAGYLETFEEFHFELGVSDAAGTATS